MIVGIGFMIHGWAKISRGTAGFEKLLMQIGVPLPHLSAIVTPYVELIGGFAILIGLFTKFITVPLVIIMLVAMLSVQVHYGFSAVNTIGLTAQGPVFGPPGYEINLLYIACLVSLFLTGAGALCVDKLIENKRKTSQ